MNESSVRNLTKTLAVLSLLAPATAHPLGIGGIKMHSSLNQNLNAEISLILSAGEKLTDVKVSLAPPDKFDEAGVPWNYFLSKIKFEPVLRPDGSAVIKVSSNEALKEPFLGLLLQVSWPKGNLFREFSVLVDPPEVYEQATVPVVRLPEQDVYRPGVPVNRYEPVARPVQRSAPTGGSMSANRYGPTSRNDTLWKIAARASKARNVSVEQMMIAIYESNPSAFFKDNINALSKGKTLKIPDREAVLKLSRKQAMAEYARHTDAWTNRSASASATTPTATAVQQQAAAVEAKDAENQLQLEAPSESSISQNAVIKPGQDRTALTENVKVADKTETGAAKNLTGNDDAAQKQITEMQRQLSKMQELLALKDQQLAALQQQASISAQAPAKPEVSAPTFRAQATPTSVASQVEMKPVETKPESVPVATPTPVASAVPGASVKPVVEVKPKLAAKPIQRKKPSAEKHIEEESELNYPIFGVAGAGLLSLLGWLWWRKRRIDAKTDTESMFAHSFISTPEEDEVQQAVMPSPVPATPTLATEESNLFNVEPVGESAFLSEFTPSDFDAFDTDRGEIDPISEADVYLAYGRYQQAEELIRQAIIEQPGRDECKLKLLEIFYASENKKAFEHYSEELASSGKKDDRIFWAKVSEMGSEMCPDSSLFTASAAFFAVSQEVEAQCSAVSLAKTAEDSLADFDMTDTLGDLSDETFDLFLKDTNEEKQEFSSEEALDFSATSGMDDDLSFASDKSAESIEDILGGDDGRDVEFNNNSAMEFDLDSLSGFKDEGAKDEKNAVSTVQLEESKSAEAGLELEMFDFNLGDADSNLETASEIDDSKPDLAADKKNGAEEFAFDEEFNFNFDLENDQDEKNGVDSFAVSDLTDMDELETKLDLARAYIDMGDEASAKQIVTQVLEKGSDEQKKVAQKFIDHLG